MERYGHINMLANKDQDHHQDQTWRYNSNPRRGINLYSSTTTGVIGAFSWPPRSYGCTFCKREFRSAQALGGHMNVHRRERARLRQYSPPSPWDTTPPPPPPNPNPNLNNPNMISRNRTSEPVPNLNVPPVLASPPSASSTLSSAVPATKSSTDGDRVKFSLFGHSYTLLKAPASCYGGEGMKIDLVMGSCCQDRRLEDGLDLELRLGSLN